MLLEELLGISNKRLKYIFSGQHVDGDSSSSTESEVENQPIDVISLDDITDSDDEFAFGNKNGDKKTGKTNMFKKTHKPFKEETSKRIKEEHEKSKINKHAKKRKEDSQAVGPDKNQLMSVLELLELQARARAIRSQLALESEKKSDEKDLEPDIKKEESDSDAVVIESPKRDEIVISSSDSESDETVDAIIQSSQLQNESESHENLESAPSASKEQGDTSTKDPDINSNVKKSRKVKIIRQRIIPGKSVDQLTADTALNSSSSSDPKDNMVDNSKDSVSGEQDTETKEPAEKDGDISIQNSNSDIVEKTTTKIEKNDDIYCISDNEADEIVINVDESEVDGMVNA